MKVFKEAGEVPKETFRAAGVKGSADEPRMKVETDQVLFRSNCKPRSPSEQKKVIESLNGPG